MASSFGSVEASRVEQLPWSRTTWARNAPWPHARTEQPSQRESMVAGSTSFGPSQHDNYGIASLKHKYPRIWDLFPATRRIRWLVQTYHRVGYDGELVAAARRISSPAVRAEDVFDEASARSVTPTASRGLCGSVTMGRDIWWCALTRQWETADTGLSYRQEIKKCVD